jgi:hypothetical protein
MESLSANFVSDCILTEVVLVFLLLWTELVIVLRKYVFTLFMHPVTPISIIFLFYSTLNNFICGIQVLTALSMKTVFWDVLRIVW